MIIVILIVLGIFLFAAEDSSEWKEILVGFLGSGLALVGVGFAWHLLFGGG